MSEARIPGVKARHAVITDACRKVNGEREAIDKALSRLRNEYLGLVRFWDKGSGVQFHLVLTVESPGKES